MNARASPGFTLIEMAIVLVVIGLIVGGVLVGEHLISAAGVRATITQIEKYNTAANTFREKYGALPGDLNQQVATAFGFAARGTGVGQGDGNGVIEGYCGGENTAVFEGGGEVSMFWMDLSYARLIDSTFTAASSTTVPSSDLTATSTPNLNAFFPQAKLGNGNYVYVYNNGTYIHGWNPGNTNYFGISAITLVSTLSNFCHVSSSPGMTVSQAFAIDKKIDDGLPVTGRVTAQYLNGDLVRTDGSDITTGQTPGTDAAASSSCFDNANGANTTYAYSVGQNNGNGVNCALSFQFQ